jgi:ferric hydroxamate transport system substrate-binding protein
MLADRIGRAAEAKALVDATEVVLTQARARLAGNNLEHQILIVTALDDRHVNVFTPSGLTGAVLRHLGLRNAWTAGGAASFVTLGVERLAAMPDTTIVAIAAGGGDHLPELAAGPLWNALPAVQAGRVLRLPPVLESGGLPAAARLARLLAEALTASRDTAE